MGRQVHIDDEGLTLTLTGFTAFFALKRRIHMPYRMIKNITVNYFQAPLWMLRMPGTSIPPAIYEGSFFYGNEWYFLSYERKKPLLQIELNGHKKYTYVIVQIDHADQIASQIWERL